VGDNIFEDDPRGLDVDPDNVGSMRVGREIKEIS